MLRGCVGTLSREVASWRALWLGCDQESRRSVEWRADSGPPSLCASLGAGMGTKVKCCL